MLRDKNRTIAHLDLDSFFVSVERLQNSKLKNKPVIIGGMGDRGVVSSCSYEARMYGVHSAMPTKMAKQLCPDAVFIRGDMDLYSKQSKIVTEIIAAKSPAFEKASIDEHYLDITGMDRFFGCMKWTHELRHYIINNTGLPISYGLSVNKTVSKIATSESKPNGEKQVEAPYIHSFLDPLSISKIPMLGKQTYRLLRSMGVDKIKTLRNIPPDMMEKVLGKNGKVIWEKANGIDNTPIQNYSERKSISSEHTFEQDTMDVGNIKDLLVAATERLCFQLRKEQWLTSCVTVKIRYANYDTHTIQKKIAYTSFDHVIAPIAHELFNKLYQRRMTIRLIGIKLSGLIHGVQQLNLFEETPEMINLYLTMDRIRKQFGSKAIRKATSLRNRPTNC
jgi:DNA polymerase IV